VKRSLDFWSRDEAVQEALGRHNVGHRILEDFFLVKTRLQVPRLDAPSAHPSVGVAGAPVSALIVGLAVDGTLVARYRRSVVGFVDEDADSARWVLLLDEGGILFGWELDAFLER
jgi:hypothetical protein